MVSDNKHEFDEIRRAYQFFLRILRDKIEESEGLDVDYTLSKSNVLFRQMK
jgi:hypothetical protein